MSIYTDGLSIGFEQLTCKVKTGILKKTEKKILDGISGTFRMGELSAIIGPSGSGKTTFLNLLSGRVKRNYEGTLSIGKADSKFIRNQSSYIMQDHALHPLLTVQEAIQFAIKFKTGTTTQHQNKKCDEILEQLGLKNLSDTLTKDLSGGERKRLTIAVELVGDPSILFIDEPTTGLDSYSSSQFVTFLSDLADSGKSIICTIHAPSALMLDAFDHVYAMAEGKCIYQGSSKNIIPFLAELDLSCPEYYNPADYLMEIATNEYGDFNQTLTETIRNGRCERFRGEVKPEHHSEKRAVKTINSKYRSTFSHQLLLLIQRNLLIMTRNKDYMLIRFVVAVAMAIVVGASFYDLGHLANHIFDNYKFIYSTTQFLSYSSFLSLMVRFPIDLSILRSEYFNRWYSSLSYYLALTIADLPVLIGVAFVYTLISYYMTGQPMEQHRLLLILLVGIMVSSTAQAFGLLAGSIFSDITMSLVAGGAIMSVHMIFSGVLVLKKDVLPWVKYIFDVTFLNHGNDGMVLALFGYDREKMECEKFYCHFRDPKEFLKLIDAPASISFHSFVIIFLIVHAVTYVNMTVKLKRID